MQPDFERTAAALVAGTQKAITAALAPVLQRIETLEKRKPEKGERGERGEPGESIKGETGVGLAGALIDRSGVLVLTLSDGTTRDLGVVVGKDGRDGKDGADEPVAEPEPSLSEDEQTALAAMFLQREIGGDPVIELPELSVRQPPQPKASPPAVVNVHLPEQHHAAPNVSVMTEIKGGKVKKTVERDDRGLIESWTEEEA